MRINDKVYYLNFWTKLKVDIPSYLYLKVRFYKPQRCARRLFLLCLILAVELLRLYPINPELYLVLLDRWTEIYTKIFSVQGFVLMLLRNECLLRD